MDNDEKARLYKQVSSRPDWWVLERMRLYGFWEPWEGLPADPPEETEERRELDAEMARLLQQHATHDDPEKALAEERQRRWEASKQKRAEKKRQREAETQARRERYAGYRKTTVVHSGPGVSVWLEDRESNAEQLQQQGLPVIYRAEELAAQLGLSLPTLRWLTYHRRGVTQVHYHRYTIPKKTGGLRAISAPKQQLAAAQQWVLKHILERLPVHQAAHGFAPEHSILTNARPHAGRQVVINMDLKDFFPSITFWRVAGVFKQLGYSGQVASLLALLCTEPPRVPVEYNGQVYHVALGDRMLPQGACTSPAITNLLCRRLDARLQGLAGQDSFQYTRYADDLTFSGDNPQVIGKLLTRVRRVLKEEGLTEHPAKTRIMRKASRQEVTGLTVNERPTISRREYRRLRALLHNAARDGLESQNTGQHPNFLNHLRGKIAFIRMVDPGKAAKLQQALDRVISGA